MKIYTAAYIAISIHYLRRIIRKVAPDPARKRTPGAYIYVKHNRSERRFTVAGIDKSVTDTDSMLEQIDFIRKRLPIGFSAWIYDPRDPGHTLALPPTLGNARHLAPMDMKVVRAILDASREFPEIFPYT